MPQHQARHDAARTAAAIIAACCAAGAVSLPAAAGQDGRSPAQVRARDRVTDPYSPSYRHAYRGGVVPSVGRLGRMRAWARTHAAGTRRTGARALLPAGLRYGGGTDGIGVTTGHEKVYLVFWGSQWGASGRDSRGDLTLAGDPAGLAPYLQRLFAGLGRGGETWSGVATQYCQGVPAGAASCPPGSRQRVAYPAGGALAGAWADEASPAPVRAAGHQIGAEAVRAAAHFGNVNAAANRDAQYLVVSPAGTHPDGFNTASGDFCAWHDWTGDPTLPGGPARSGHGDVAFTNLPYITDAGRACGQNFVNSGRAGLLDGVSMIAGHEYAETITDQNPPGGWTDAAGDETADLCQWNSGPGARAADLTLPTGLFAMQPLWANSAGGTGGTGGTCELTHPVVPDGGGGANTVTVTRPGSQRTARGAAVSLRVHAADSAPGRALAFTASGLPPGLKIGAATGTISGRPAAPGAYRVTVTAADTTGASGSAAFTWTVTGGIGILASLLARIPGGTQWLVWARAHGKDIRDPGDRA